MRVAQQLLQWRRPGLQVLQDGRTAPDLVLVAALPGGSSPAGIRQQQVHQVARRLLSLQQPLTLSEPMWLRLQE